MNEPSVVAVGTPQSFRQQLARALEIEPEEVGWVQSATAAEELLIHAFNPIEVLVLSPEVKEPDALGLAEFVGRQAPGTAIVLVRDHTWNGLLPAAMRAGIRDVVDMTQGNEELRDAVERAIVWASNLRSVSVARSEGFQSQKGRIMSVFSSKGGAGKTFLTTNLACAIAEITGQDTAVVDLDFDMGDVFTYFGTEPATGIPDLMALGEGASHEQVRSVGQQVGDHLWAFGAPIDPAAEAPAGESIGKFLRAIRNDFPHVVVDASVDYSDSALVCFDLSDIICLVTGLDVVGVKHLGKALDTLLTIGLPRERFRVVLNRADSKVGLDASDVERVMKIQVDAMIPSSRLVPTSLNKGRPVVLDEPSSEVAVAVRQLAGRFLAGTPGDEMAVEPDGRSEEEEAPVRRRASTRDPRRLPRCPSQTGWPKSPAEGPDRPRSGSRCKSAWSRCLGPRLYDSTLSDNELEGLVHQRLRELLDEEEGPLSAQEKLLIVRQIGDSVLGLGPLEPYVRDPEVTEIMVNKWDTIYVERAGKLYWTGTKFHDEQQLRRTIDKIVGKVGRRVDEASPVRGRPSARRFACQRGDPAARDRRSRPDDPEVLRRPLPGRRPGGVRHDELVDRQVPGRLRPRPHQHHGVRRNRRRQDDHLERVELVHPR